MSTNCKEIVRYNQSNEAVFFTMPHNSHESQKSWFKNEVTLGQLLSITIPLFLAIISYWVSTRVNDANKEVQILLLQAEVSNLKNSQDKQNSYVIQSFGEIQKTMTAIQINMVNKKDREEK